MEKFRLEDIDKKEPFEAPEKYFDDFPLRMLKRIETKKTGAAVWLPSLSTRWALSALATVLLIVTGIFVWQTRTVTDADPLAAIATADLVYYLDNETIGSDELVRVFDQTEVLDSLWDESELGILPQEEMSDEELLLLYDQLTTEGDVL